MVSLSGLVKIALLLLLLPMVNMVLCKRNWAPIFRDLFTAKASAAVAALGCILIALSFHPAIAGAGMGIVSLSAGFSPAVRSIASSLVNPEHIGTLYTAMGVVLTLGIILSGPVVAISFRIGLQLGGLWSGLPYVVSTALLLMTIAALSRIRPPIASELPIEEEGTDDESWYE
jgi:hypothetical protein